MFGKKKADIAGQEGKQKTNDRKIFAFTMFTIANIFAVSAGSFAWFYSATHNSSLTTVSGDLNVKIKTVTAHKYVYPYYNNSSEFIDYESSGIVKGYVVENASMDVVSNYASTTTIPLTTPVAGTISTSAGTSSVIRYTTTVNAKTVNERLKYFLVGDATFNGVSSDPWSVLTGVGFNSTSPITSLSPAIASNVVVSQGATFRLFDATTVSDGSCTYFGYGEPSGNDGKNPCFEITNDGLIKCLRSGIYNFTHRLNVVEDVTTKYLDITLARSDDAIIDNNILDPTIVTLDYYALDPSTRGTLDDYLTAQFPKEIQKQNTMVILDVELGIKNENPITVDLKVLRDAQSASSIYGLDGKYNNDSDFVNGVDGKTADPELMASDFYSYYTVLSDEANKLASSAAIWSALHLETKARVEDAVTVGVDFQKFQNNASFDREIACTLHLNGSTPSTTIAGSDSEKTYHCYIAIEYDYEHCKFFTNKNRTGKRYILSRDFRFQFTGTQETEG